jgi:hypothetical protein
MECADAREHTADAGGGEKRTAMHNDRVPPRPAPFGLSSSPAVPTNSPLAEQKAPAAAHSPLATQDHCLAPQKDLPAE